MFAMFDQLFSSSPRAASAPPMPAPMATVAGATHCCHGVKIRAFFLNSWISIFVGLRAICLATTHFAFVVSASPTTTSLTWAISCQFTSHGSNRGAP